MAAAECESPVDQALQSQEKLYPQHQQHQELYKDVNPPETLVMSAPTRVAKIGKAQAAWRVMDDALAKLPKLETITNEYHIVDDFLLQIEVFADRYDCQNDLLDIAEYRMSPQVVYFYNRRLKLLLPEKEKSYKVLAEVMT